MYVKSSWQKRKFLSKSIFSFLMMFSKVTHRKIFKKELESSVRGNVQDGIPQAFQYHDYENYNVS